MLPLNSKRLTRAHTQDTDNPATTESTMTLEQALAENTELKEALQLLEREVAMARRRKPQGQADSRRSWDEDRQQRGWTNCELRKEKDKVKGMCTIL